MATRKHSIKVPVNFGNPADLTDNILTVLGTPTIYIPENSAGSPVTFTAAMLYVAAQDVSTATGGTVNVFRAQATLSGAVANSVTLTGTLANSAENWGGLFGPIDYTSYFISNFGTVTSKTCQVEVLIDISTGTGTNSRGVYAYFELTYQYDDSAATRIQTICIPYESSTTTLPTTTTNTFCTIPQLTGAGGLLNGYASPVVRHRWMEIKGNCNNNGTNTDHNLVYKFDLGGANSLPTRESGLASDSYQVYLVDASGQTTTATHTFQLYNSLATRWANIIVNEWVSFEYTVAGTTEVLNYVELPLEFDSPVAGTAATVNDLIRRVFTLPEPGTITTRNCAVEINYSTPASATAQMKTGNQASYRGYAQSSNVVAGGFSFQHRIDPGSGGGGTFALTRGDNNIDVYLYRSAGSMTNVSGVIRLLYSSGVASTGIDTHSQVRYAYIRQLSLTTTSDDTVTGDSYTVPETNYYMHSVGFNYTLWSAATAMTILIQARVLAGEGAGDGWRDIYLDSYQSDAVIANTSINIRARDEFKRYPNDPDTNRLDVETARNYRTVMTTTSRYGSKWVVCYHGITWTVSGTISSSSGGTVNIALYRKNTSNEYELYDSTTRTGNGSYSFTVYDDTADYYVAAYETDSLKGLSKQATPTTGFDIDLAGGGGGGGEFFF